MEPFLAGPSGQDRPNELKNLNVDSWTHINSDKPISHSHLIKISRFKHVLEQYDPPCTPNPDNANGTGKHMTDNFTVTVGGIQSHWEFRVYPNGYDEDNRNYLGIFVKHKDTPAHKSINPPQYLIKSVIQLLDSRGERKVKVDLPGKILNKKQMHGTKKYIEREALLSNPQLYFDDSITFLLEAEICHPKTKTTSSEVVDVHSKEVNDAHKSQLASYETMGSNFSRLLEEGSFSDVKIHCEGKEFSCHKALLSYRSSVFQAMFQHQNMKEQQMNVVDIVDLSWSTVDRMLKYIYSGKLSSQGDEDNELLAAADKYDLTDLKVSCERSLSSSLNNQNCVDLLILADRHTAISLRKSAMSFVLGNLSAVTKMADWCQKLTPYPDIMAQIIQEMAKDGQPKTKRRKKELAVIFDDVSTESESDIFENAIANH